MRAKQSTLMIAAAVVVAACGAACARSTDVSSGPGSGGSFGSGGASAGGGLGTTSGGVSGSGGASSGGSAGPKTGGSTGTDSGGSSGSGGATSGGSAGARTGGDAATSSGGQSGGGGASAGGRAGAMTGGSTGTSSGGSSGRGGSSGGSGTGGGGGAGPDAGAKDSSVMGCASPPATLRAAAECTGRLMGTAIAVANLSDSSLSNIAATEFNHVTPENEMKWDTIEPTQGKFNYGPADNVVSFASQHNMKVKGHTLVWHNQLPSWVSSLSSAAAVTSAMNNHITSVMTHFKGKVSMWDVVNEAWITPDDEMGTGTPSLRNDVFMKQLGADYIDMAFQTARKADKDALLFYNDYLLEWINDRSTAVYEMVRSMVQRGIPIDGVGIQTHAFKYKFSGAEFAENMKRFTDLGLKVVISEMDVNCCVGYTLAEEATMYHDTIAACVANPSCMGATVWGISDKLSWINDYSNNNCKGGQLPTPLLFDDSYAKKQAYTGVLNALLGR